MVLGLRRVFTGDRRRFFLQRPLLKQQIFREFRRIVFQALKLTAGKASGKLFALLKVDNRDQQAIANKVLG